MARHLFDSAGDSQDTDENFLLIVKDSYDGVACDIELSQADAARLYLELRIYFTGLGLDPDNPQQLLETIRKEYRTFKHKAVRYDIIDATCLLCGKNIEDEIHNA